MSVNKQHFIPISKILTIQITTLPKVLPERRALIIQHLIRAELVLKPVALLLRPSDGDDLCTGLLAELDDEGADGAGGTGDEEAFAFLDLADVVQALERRQ